MSRSQRQADIIYTRGGGDIETHLRQLYSMVVHLVASVNCEPADIETSWRDDDEFTGWRSIIKWPVQIVLEPPTDGK